jgi:hypothetical protein
MRVYISGPITGHEEDAKERFRKTADYVMNIMDAETIDPELIGRAAAENADLDHEEYMEIAFTLLRMCDAIYLMPGWEDSRGCQMEKVYAENRGMKILTEETVMPKHIGKYFDEWAEAYKERVMHEDNC